MKYSPSCCDYGHASAHCLSNPQLKVAAWTLQRKVGYDQVSASDVSQRFI
jgi:hypothetical protein